MNVLISLLGSSLDAHGHGSARWNIWRPSVALAMQENLQFDRYYLIYQHSYPIKTQKRGIDRSIPA